VPVTNTQGTDSDKRASLFSRRTNYDRKKFLFDAINVVRIFDHDAAIE
jgi:hypothetical protein